MEDGGLALAAHVVRRLQVVFPHCPVARLRHCVASRTRINGIREDGPEMRSFLIDDCINVILDRRDFFHVEEDVRIGPRAAAAEPPLPKRKKETKGKEAKKPRGERDVVLTIDSDSSSGSDVVQIVKEKKFPVEKMLQDVLMAFPDADPGFVRERLLKEKTQHAERVCNYLLEHAYPKVKKDKPMTSGAPTKETPVNYFTEYANDLSRPAHIQVMLLLSNDFPLVAKRDIERVAMLHNYHYAVTRRCLEETLGKDAAQAECRRKVFPELPPVMEVLVGQPLMNKRKRAPAKFLLPEVGKEVEFYHEHELKLAERRALEQESIATGSVFDCGCCFSEFFFEDMIQCMEGHLFCCQCLSSYAKEATYGSGKAELECMESDCGARFMKSQLQKALSADLLAKYEERVAEECLQLAAVPDLVRCPRCNFGAQMAPDDKVFRCQNPECMKETCRYCKEDWNEHFGLKCSEVQTRSDTAFRTLTEERMTAARVRTCHTCHTEFFKVEGCNRMTCRCGATLCYICRKPNITYNHFCAHPRDPKKDGAKCKKCTACSLWTNSHQDEEMAIAEIKTQAEKERNQLAQEQSRSVSIRIGPDS